METSEFKTKYARVLEVINQGRYERALSMLRRLVEWNNLPSDYIRKVNNLQAKFFYMLRYMLDTPGASSPDAELKSLREAVMRLALEIERDFYAEKDNSEYYARVRYAKLRPEESLESLFADYLDELNRLSKDASALMDTRSRSRLEQLSDSIFGLIWTDLHMDSDTRNTVLAMVSDSDLPTYDRSIWTAAVGLGLFNKWNVNRFSLLQAIISSATDKISEVASIWSGLILLTYFNIESLTPIIHPYAFNLNAEQYQKLYRLAVQLARQIGAPALSARFSSSELSGLSGIGRSFSKDINADADPMEAVEKAMSELPEGSFDKIKDFTEAVRNGYDVFYSSLGKMRNYDFFRRSSNWLLPFHADHSSLAPVVDTEGLAIAEMMEKMRSLADSDKFAMILSIVSAPENIRSSMLQSMTAPISAMMDNPEMEQMYSEEGTLSEDSFTSVYLKNLYRFWILGPGKELPLNPFALGVRGSASLRLNPFSILSEMENEERPRPDNWLKLPRALADAGFPAFAGQIIERMMSQSKGDYRGELALAGQYFYTAGDYADAARLLENHLELDRDDYEAALLLARIDLEYDEYENSVMVLERFRDSHGADNRFLELMGRLQVRIFDYDDALQLLLQLDYQLPENSLNTESELALISALAATGARDNALEHLDKLEFRSGVSAVSLIQRGVILWEDGKRRDALNCFGKALSLKTFTEEKFLDKVHELHRHVHQTIEPDYLPDVLPSMLEFSKGSTSFGKL